MKRVLHTIDNFLPHTQNWVYPQVTSVPDTISAVLCTAMSGQNQFPLDGTPIFCEDLAGNWPVICRRLARLGGRYWGARRALERARNWRPDIIHAHFGTRGWKSLSLKRATHTSLITNFYGVEAWSLPNVEPIWRERFAELFEEGDLFLVEGPVMRRRLIEIGCPSDKIGVRHLGVDLSQLPYLEPEFDSGLKIAMVGRFVEKKGLADGLKACLGAAEAGVRVQITVIGDSGENDPQGQAIKEELVRLSRKPALNGKVRFTGFLTPTDVRAMLRSHNIMLCPSKHSADGDAEGGMPYVLAEAMAMGLLAIGSRHCDMSELIIENNTGFLFDEGDVESLTCILSKLSGVGCGLVKICENGRRHVEKHFDLNRQLAKLREYYDAHG